MIFFKQALNNGKTSLPLMEFLEGVSGFNETGDNGADMMNVSLGMEYYQICEKMADDFLLLRIKPNVVMPLSSEYLGVHEVNSTDPQAFIRELDYGLYDFKYRGFTYTYEHFKESVVPIEGFKHDGKADIGTAYYIGDRYFVTAAHCVTGLQRFNLLKGDGTPYALKEVWFAAGQNLEDYDLAVLWADEEPACPALWLGEPAVLDEILTMGYPPIPCFNLLLTAETVTVANYGKIQRKAVTGQVVGNSNTYFNQLDYFLISARVKGGNSGGPVINNEGKVVGTVIEIPFDSEGGSDSGRYDIMGFGVCLPSKYVDGLLANPDAKSLVSDNGYCRMAD